MDRFEGGHHWRGIEEYIRATVPNPEPSVKNNREAAEGIVAKLPAPDSTPPAQVCGLMYGKIQAGKTNGVCATIALAADSGYRLFIVLTTDNTTLGDQTKESLEKALRTLYLPALSEEPTAVAELIRGHGAVFACTKNAGHLRKLQAYLTDLEVADVPCLIVDDEADAGSLNTNATEPQEDPATINALITGLRDHFPVSCFLQVTATPQPLLLQPAEHDFHPEFIILLDAGPDYVGGRRLFDDENTYVRHFDVEELSQYLNSAAGVPQSLRRAVHTFMLAAVIKQLKLGRKEKGYTFLCHVHRMQALHGMMQQAIRSITSEVGRCLGEAGMQAQLREAYDDLLQTLAQPPAFEAVLTELASNITGTSFQVLNGQDGSPQKVSYTRLMNFIIGGNRVGRGLRFDNLLGTYYGRATKRPHADTMTQHARMYGYREEHLDVTRIFIPQDMAEMFRQMDDEDEELRGLIRSGVIPNPIHVTVPVGMTATRRNVLAGRIGFYGSEGSYLPAYPKSNPTDVAELTPRLDALLAEFNPGNAPQASAERVTIGFLIELLGLTPSNWEQGGRWVDDSIRMALTAIRERYADTGYLIVRRGRNLTKPRDGRLHEAGSWQERELVRRDYPTLTIYRQTGDGWEGTPFWIPRLTFPHGDYGAIVFNYPPTE